MTVFFRPIEAWTFIVPGDPHSEGRTAAARAASRTDRSMKKNEREALEADFVRLARHQEQIAAPDFAVLTSMNQPARTVAWLAVHFVDDQEMVDRVLEDAWDEQRKGALIEDPFISTVRTPLGDATRVVLHHRPDSGRLFRRAPSMTSVRYVQPFEDDLRDRVLLVTASIPLDVDRDLGIEHIDRFVLNMSTTPPASSEG